MTEQDYLEELKKIIKRIRNGENELIQEELMELYNYKPVRLLWHIAYGELMASQGKLKEAWQRVSDYHYDGLEYSGIEERESLHRDILEKNGNHIKMLEYRYGKEDIQIEIQNRLENTYSEYIENDSLQNLEKLMREYYITGNCVTFLIIRMKLLKLGYIKNDDKNEWYYKITNYDYFESVIQDPKKDIILVEDSKNSKECDLISSILYEFGHKVYILSQPTCIENVMLHTEEITKICIENEQIYEDAVLLPTIETINDKGIKENNRAEIIKYLYEKDIDKGFATILASGTVFEELLKEPVIQKNIECLADFSFIRMKDKLYFGWAGNYLEYINELYGVDVKQKMEKEGEYDFSIIIPARNSAGTLYYTLQTCLNQDYKGSYEIIVSDNSTNGSQEVYQVCQDLDDSRIKYVKTPRNLQLTKSFEYAFLQAKGEFIFSIGSDDGVCPWALSVLSDILKNNSEDEIVQWQRGFYGWTGFNSSQENELLIPECYIDKEIKYKYVENIEYFARIFKNSQWMYGLPTLYINAGFRRSYFKTLLRKTGRLWDGNNQDLYMGIITAAIKKKILNVEFPLTIAGMSNNSLGYIAGRPKNLNTTKEEIQISQSSFLKDNCGINVPYGIVKEIPIGTGEVFLLYANILRAIQLGVLPEIWRTEVLDYKKIFMEFFIEHTCLDDSFDRYLHYARYLAEKRGDEFLAWFDETIYKPAIVPRYYVKNDVTEKDKKSYKEGINPNGSLILDASKYGVTNIAEAVKLFKELIYWTPETYEKELEKRKVHD